MASCYRYLQYKVAARVLNASQPASWATGPYFPYPNLNITGHVMVQHLLSLCRAQSADSDALNRLMHTLLQSLGSPISE